METSNPQELNVNPKKKKRYLFFAVTFLVILLLVFYIIYVKTKTEKPPVEAPQDLNGPTEAQRDTAIAEMKARIATNPPVSQSQIDEALQALKNRMKQ